MKTLWKTKAWVVVSFAAINLTTGTAWAADAAAPAAATPALVLAAPAAVSATATPAAIGIAPAPAAASSEDLSATVDALKRRLADLEKKLGETPEAQQVRQEEIKGIVEQMLAQNQRALSTPSWLENLKFAGDLRLRYDIRQFDENSKGPAGTLDNTKIFRFRARFGVTKTWPDDDLEVGLRFASGADNDPTTEMQTFGASNFAGSTTNASAFEEYPDFGIDRVYAKWTPKAAKGLMVEAGKFANPWETSALMWSPEVSPEGVWAEYRVPTGCPIEPFVGAGWFQIYTSTTKRNADMEAYDAGVRWAITPDVKWTSAATFYKFTNLDVAFSAAGTSGGIPAMSNTGAKAGQYPLLDVINKVDFKTFNIPTNAYFDWVHNTDNESHNGHSDAWAAGLRFGDIKKKGDWDARYVYRVVERDSVLGYFTDPTFGYPSRTARKGHEVGVDYALTDALTAGLTVWYDTPMAGTTAGNKVDVMVIYFDLNWRF
jgi:hypothetical protein